jgi:micrococcal nuclease
MIRSILIALALSTPAMADPCEGKLPKRGEVFTGKVVYVGDGDSLCTGNSDDPKTWIEVRLADYYAPELHEEGGEAAKQMLSAVARGKNLTCTARNRSYDRIVAECTLNGNSIGAILRQSGLREGGRGR